MQTLLSVVVGSQLHGLADENSDTDTAHIVMTPLKTILSPFVEKLAPKVVSNTDGDSTAYELRHVCKLAAHGNPTVLEVLWSNKVLATTPLGQQLQANRHRFLDDTRVYDAHRKYASSQIVRISRAEPGELSGEVNDLRRGKLAAAAMRVYSQGRQLLQYGDFSPQVTYRPDFLRRIKKGISQEEYNELVRLSFVTLERNLDRAFESCGGYRVVDTAWIEEFTYEAYTKGQ